MPIRDIMIKKSLSLKKKSAKKKKCNIRRKKNLLRRNLKSRNKRGGSGFEQGDHEVLQNQIIKLAETVGIRCNPAKSNEYKALESLIKKYSTDSEESPLSKSYKLQYQSLNGNSDYYTPDSELIKTILGGSGYNDREKVTIKFHDNASRTLVTKVGTLTESGKDAFREVAKQGSLNEHLDKSFLDINRILKEE